MAENSIKVYHVKDETVFGYDITEDNKRVWYFIQVDFFGDGRRLGIWNPNNKLRSYTSFKEALIYQAIANENGILPVSKHRVVRSYGQFNFKNIEVVNTENEAEYYGLDIQ